MHTGIFRLQASKPFRNCMMTVPLSQGQLCNPLQETSCRILISISFLSPKVKQNKEASCFFNRAFEIKLFKGKYKKKIQHFGGPRKENLGSSVTLWIYLRQARSWPPEHLSIISLPTELLVSGSWTTQRIEGAYIKKLPRI